MLPGWRPLADVAREAAAREGCTPRTIRNRLLAVNAAAGGGLLRSFERSGPARKYWVNPTQLEQALRSGPDSRAAELEWLESRVERLEQQGEALRRAYRTLRRRADELERAKAKATNESPKPEPAPVASPFGTGADGRDWREAG